MSQVQDTEEFAAVAVESESLWETVCDQPVFLTRVSLEEAETVANASASEDLSASGSGRYQILGEIARGGMGAVLRGRDSDLNRDLAVKVLLDQHRDRPEMLRRFFEEAQIGGQLQHPGIVPVYEMGFFPDSRPFFAMKLVKGRTLASLLQERATVGEDRPRFLIIFEHVCQTVAYAHSRGVIHRDLKPLNIMVGAFGEVQVMDWGLAKVLGGAGGSEVEIPPEIAVSVIRTVRSNSKLDESMAGSVMGTPAYMSPEQAQGELDRMDERADVFGLGSILCEILTGKPAYAGRSAAEVLRKAEHADLADAWSRLDASAADHELISLAKACLAAEPADRPRDAGVVTQRLTTYFSGVQDRLRAAELAHVEATGRAHAERVRRKFTVALIGSVCVTLLIGGGAWLAFARFRDDRILATNHAVGQALFEAEALHQKAIHKGLGDHEAWSLALIAADKVKDILSGRIARPELSTHVEAFYVTVQRDAEKAKARLKQLQADQSFIQALELACLEHSDGFDDGIAVIPHYAEAFRNAGLDLEKSTAEAAILALKAREQTERIASVLDDWSRRETNLTQREKMVAIARAIDPDRFRNRVRDATMAHNRAALKVMAAVPQSDQLPALSANLLALSLADCGERAEATTLLAKAQRRYPGDFWINHDLGMLYLDAETPQPDEAIRFLTTAVALKLDNPGARVNLGQALAAKNRQEEALDSFRDAVGIRPNFAPALLRIRAGLRGSARPQKSPNDKDK